MYARRWFYDFPVMDHAPQLDNKHRVDMGQRAVKGKDMILGLRTWYNQGATIRSILER